MYYDNLAIVFFFMNNNNGSQNKHINTKYFIVREKVNEHKVFIKHIGTKLMIADPMTKALSVTI